MPPSASPDSAADGLDRAVEHGRSRPGGTCSEATRASRSARPVSMSRHELQPRTAGRQAPTPRPSPPMARIAAAQTIPAAAVRERPWSRRRSTKGAKNAEMTTATAIDAVTVHSSVARSQSTTSSPAMARTRQPRAAMLIEPVRDERAGPPTQGVGRCGPGVRRAVDHCPPSTIPGRAPSARCDHSAPHGRIAGMPGMRGGVVRGRNG